MAAMGQLKRATGPSGGERPVSVASINPFPNISAPAVLPPEGASPAGDLQRRVSDAALRNFYASSRTRLPETLVKPLAVLAITLCSWAAVFGVGALIVR